MLRDGVCSGGPPWEGIAAAMRGAGAGNRGVSKSAARLLMEAAMSLTDLSGTPRGCLFPGEGGRGMA